jgi:hypothetical protein
LTASGSSPLCSINSRSARSVSSDFNAGPNVIESMGKGVVFFASPRKRRSEYEMSRPERTRTPSLQTFSSPTRPC